MKNIAVFCFFLNIFKCFKLFEIICFYFSEIDMNCLKISEIIKIKNKKVSKD